MSAALPNDARAERQAIWDRYGTGSVVESPIAVPPEGATLVVRSASCEAAAAIEAWSAKWNVEKYGILRPYRIECSGDGHFSYYHITVPEFAEEPSQ